MEIKYIEPSVLHDEMLRLRKEKQMDFLECLSGMDWGIPDEKDAPDTPRGLGVVYLLESTVTGERIAVRTATLNREHPELPSCLLYTSPSPRDRQKSRMPSSA